MINQGEICLVHADSYTISVKMLCDKNAASIGICRYLGDIVTNNSLQNNLVVSVSVVVDPL